MFPFPTPLLMTAAASGGFTAHGPISFVGSDAFTTNTTPSSRAFSNLLNSAGGTPTLQQGDIVIGTFAQAVNSGQNPAYTGATTIGGSIVGSGSSAVHFFCFYKFMGATPDTTLDFTLGAGGTSFGSAVIVHVFRGVDTTTPIDAVSSVGAPNSLPSVTPVTSGAWVIAAAGETRSSSNLSPTSFSNPSGFDATTNALRSAYNNATVDQMAGVAFWSGWTSGAVSGGNMGGSAAVSNWAALQFALRPAP